MTDTDEDDEHGPWSYTEFGVQCYCGYPVDRNEQCTRPLDLPAKLGTSIAEEPAIGAIVLAWTGTALEAFQRADDGWWRSTTGRSHGWKYLLQRFTPLTLVHPAQAPR